jgi:16S rRNA (adenine1518-N6/adenine1519-N6)-dimethyltransferase
MVRARKRFGQHFLEPSWVGKVVDAIEPGPEDVFLEIGPGRGALTFALADRAAAVVAVEIDRTLAAQLRRSARSNVTVIESDILRIDLAAVLREHAGGRPARVAGNLPYNISSPILFSLIRLFRAAGGISDATVMLQLEVAERLAAQPGSRDYGVLSILASLWADIDLILSLPPGAFRPVPKVRSAVVHLRFRQPRVDVGDPDTFEALVKALFSQRRKTLSNALKPFAARWGQDAAAILRQAGIDGRRRPETLDLAELALLCGRGVQPRP